MYRRPKFLELLLEIRRDMALEADYDVDLFAEMARTGKRSRGASSDSPDDPTLPSSEAAELQHSRGA